MASARLLAFQNMPHLNLAFNTLSGNGNGVAMVHAVNIVGSLSLSRFVWLGSHSGSTQAASSVLLTVRMGLYSRNGATLSLANSGSRALTLNNVGLSWQEISSFATMSYDITPGTWYIWFQAITSNSGGASFAHQSKFSFVIDAGGIPAGPFIRGYTTTNTNSNPPGSIATSVLTKEGASNVEASYRQPYFFITAG